MEEFNRFCYLDVGSAELLLPEARAAWIAASDLGLGDPRGLHHAARRAAQALAAARQLTADLVGARADEVIFLPSGAAAARAAIAGLALGRRRVGTAIVASAVEHSTVVDCAGAYGEARLAGVDAYGRVELGRWDELVRSEGVALACLQAANQEVGTRQPVTAAAQSCAAAGVPLVVDAGAVLGRDAGELGAWSALTAGAQSFGGPPSVGLLVLRRGVRWRPPDPTDDYQDSRSLGAPDVPSVLAAVTALQVMTVERESRAARQAALIGLLRSELARIPDLDVIGDPVDRVPHLLTFSALYVDGETLVLELDRAGFAVASGSACSARSETPSHVLAAMGALTHGNVRVGLARDTTEADVRAFAAAVGPAVARIRTALGAP
ncbi:MAG: cysteine desulfurase family protein [Propionibacteriaceae bacterium]